jgi:hypothetical protein
LRSPWLGETWTAETSGVSGENLGSIKIGLLQHS